MHADELRARGLWLNLAGISFCLFLPNVVTVASDWPGFRGPNGSGVSDARGLPIEFGPKINLLWKAKVPGGNSSPVAAGDRIFLAGYNGNRRTVCCIDQSSGSKLWEHSIEAARTERKTEPNDPATSTPVTDGRNIHVLFSGFGLLSYTMDGEERW